MALLEMTAYSQILATEVEFFVILPEDTKGLIGMEGKEDACCPTLYLLHGMSDDHSIWLRRTSIERYAAEKGLAVVMPSTDLAFYTDMAMGENYWQFISDELPAMCRSFFPQLSPRREDTFVAGLSMGGYGALKCGLRASHTFSCAAGLSSCADIVDTVENTKLARKEFWEDIYGDLSRLKGSFNDLFAAAEDYSRQSAFPVKFYLWCGTEDYLYRQTVRLRDHMMALNMDLTYEESPGVHAWKYWDAKIQSVINWLPIRKGAY